jgi:putative redox protein
MATSKVIYTSNLRTEATHILSGDKVITDAPPDNMGRGEAFSPTDMVATSLATCMMTIMGIAANERGFSIDGMTASVTKVMYSDPRRIGEIHISLTFPPNNYSDKEKKIIERVAYTCPVSQSLHPDLKQEISFLFS